MAIESIKTTTNLNYVRKIVIFLVTLLLITSGFSILAINPGLANDDGESSTEQAPRNSGRGSRTIQYTMNLSRPGRHQDMTIIGSRVLQSPFEAPPIKNSTVGDVNGDGIDDLIIGAPGDDYNDRPNGGIIYVIFGKTNLPTTFDLAVQVPNFIIYGKFFCWRAIR